MPSYTAILFTNPDGSYTAKIPALPACQAEGVSRAQALDNVKDAVSKTLSDLARENSEAPQESWSPARTVWVRNPRRGDTSPYLIAIERLDEDNYQATPAVFPDLQETASTIEEALTNISPLIYQCLENLVAEGRHFPIQDDPQSYVVRVPSPQQ